MDELGGFIERLRESFPVKEISLETTPRELTGENIELLKAVGINRLSVGVQSFDEQVLKTMGRVNGPAEEVKSRLLRRRGAVRYVERGFRF